MKKRRTELGLSAQAVADRTIEVGHPIGRGAIARLETGSRGMVDVAELLVLAEVLEVSPAALVWWDAPDGKAQPLPGVYSTAGDGFELFTGTDHKSALHNSEHLFDSLVRASSLKRLLEARKAVSMATTRAHFGDEDKQQAVVDSLAVLERAERQAARDGWTVEGYDNG